MNTKSAGFGQDVAIESGACRQARWLAGGTKLFQYFVMLASLVVSAGVATAQSQYAGTYAGTYSGGQSGTWLGIADSAGQVMAFCTNSTGGVFSGEGTVSATGGWVVGFADPDVSFNGQIDGTGHVAGTWNRPADGKSGTFSGKRAEPYVLTTNNGTITISGYTGPGGTVSIPATLNGRRVTCIGEGAFDGCQGLIGVTIPNSVTNIGSFAFYDCTSLTSVTIPNSVASIGDWAYYNCASLTNATIGNSVTNIGSDAFESCSRLTSVTIPSSLTSLGDSAFAYCTSLWRVYFKGNAPSAGMSVFNGDFHATVYYIAGTIGWGPVFEDLPTALWDPLASYNPYDYSTDNSEITITRYSGSGGAVVIPSILSGLPVTSIGESAFAGCTSLTNVTIPASVTSIWGSAFSDCTNLVSVTVGSSVTGIGYEAFYHCISLREVFFQGNAPLLGSSVFAQDDNAILYYLAGTEGWDGWFTDRPAWLWRPQAPYSNYSTNNGTATLTKYAGEAKSLTIPSSLAGLPVTGIGNGAFEECLSLTSVTIPNSVTNIGDGAFYGCASLTWVTLPNSLTSIADATFYGCIGLTNITIPNGVTNVGDFAFVCCFKLTSVTIPNNVTTIRDYAFYCCTKLTSVSIPNSVTSIWNNAFEGCTNLTRVTVGNSLTSLGAGTFESCAKLRGVYFQGNAPSMGLEVFSGDTNAIVYYLPGTTGWETTFGGVPTIEADFIAPSLGITSHADLQLVSTSAVTLVGTASDAGSGDNGIASVTINGARAANDTATGSAVANWSKTVSLTPGTNKLVIVAKDRLGNAATNRLSLISDTSKPTLTITNPVSGQRISNAVWTVKGKATDNVAASSVWYRLNGAADWLPAIGVPVGPASFWSAPLSLAQRTNKLEAYTIDTTGNRSTTNSVSFLYIVSDTLTVRTNGSGILTPNCSGKLLEIGQSYTLTAKAGAGYVFSNWVNGAGAVLTNGTILKFTMQSNLTLVANFVPNRFIPGAGTYVGLFYNTNAEGITVSNAGLFTATVTTNGGFTGKLQVGAAQYSLAGQFSLTGGWSTNVIKGTPGWSASLHLSLTGGDEITGQISNGAWTAEVAADRAIYSRTNPAPLAGQYTLVIPGSGDPANLPGGAGALAVNVSSSGAVAIAGTLGDGEPLTQGTFVSKHGQWPLYAVPYSKKGILLGWMTFTTLPGTPNDLAGLVGWIKPGLNGTKIYPKGFYSPYDVATNNAFGSAFTNKVPLLSWTNGVVILKDGNLAQNMTNGLAMGAGNKVTGTNGLALTLKTTGVTAGLFSGSVVVNPKTKAVKAISGALLQDQNTGWGWFLGINQSGSVWLAPR